MARYFYAFRWAYGIGATWDDGSWPGGLYVFDSRAERDAWVADDVFDGNWHCEAITAKEARHIMADTVIGLIMIWPHGTTVAGRLSNGTRLPPNWSGHGGVSTCNLTQLRIWVSDRP